MKIKNIPKVNAIRQTSYTTSVNQEVALANERNLNIELVNQLNINPETNTNFEEKVSVTSVNQGGQATNNLNKEVKDKKKKLIDSISKLEFEQEEKILNDEE